ncbi:hypothetical protein Taro_034494 [Colocasia esculenta]|uniref:Uncharacterized protein n=1 Tax=Colocasia esculenta TaxID=4460 RepID=A0A843VWJ3_COLES|nr:hypothetical protein [Colocasia esculenta]
MSLALRPNRAESSIRPRRGLLWVSSDVDLEACVLTWFWRVEAIQSVENTDRASFCEFFLLKFGVHRNEDLSWFLYEHHSIGPLSEKATGRAVAFRELRAESLKVPDMGLQLCVVYRYLYLMWVVDCCGTSCTSFSGVEVNLCSVEVVWCDLPLVVFTLPKPRPWFACETCSLDSGLPVRLVVEASQLLGRLVILC